MDIRDKMLISLRPVVSTAQTPSPEEAFQNETLRPILKFQHNLLIAICRQQFIKRKSVFFQLDALQQEEYIEQMISRDAQFKQLLLGLIYGLFTLEEYQFFIAHEPELRKRLSQLLIQRLQSVPPEGWRS